MANVRIVPATKTANTLHDGYGYDLVGEQVRVSRFDTATSQWVDLTRATLSTAEQLALRDRLVAKHPLPVVRAPEPTPTPTPAPTPPVVQTPPPAPSPAPSQPAPAPQPTRPDFQLGVVLGSYWPGLPAKAQAAFGPTLGRIGNDVTASQTDQMVRECLAAGIDPHICILRPLTPAGFVTFVERYLALGVRRFEIENETSYVSASSVPSVAAAYAQRVKSYGEALKAAGVTGAQLLVQADDALRNAGWVASMFKEVPNLAEYVHGWVVHPYTANREVEQLNKAVRDLQEQGVTNPDIYASEYGVACTVDGVTLVDSKGVPSNYGHSTNLTWRVGGPLQAERIQAMIDGCPNLRALWVYHATNGKGAHNLRETNFGQMTWPDLTVIPEKCDPLKALSASLKTTG